MDADFWHERWGEGRTAFHEGQENRLLARNAQALGEVGHMLVPLCGKTRDMAWLAEQGWRVTGVELSEIAARDFFAEAGVSPDVSDDRPYRRYAAGGVTILAGDMFALTAERLGAVDAIYDRAALVALPDAMRARYAEHLVAITGGARQLLITFDYDQAMMDGPPFSVPPETVHGLYDATYTCSVIDQEPAHLRGTPVEERIWTLEPR